MNDMDQLAIQLECPFCRAKPGEWCVTARPYYHAPGRRAVWLHNARCEQVRQAWKIGWNAGAAMVYGSVAQRLEARLEGAWWAREMPTDPQGLVRWLREHEAPRG